MNIEDAKSFVISCTITPILDSNSISQKIKDITKHSLQVINHFKRIGDLGLYLSRFNNENSPLYQQLTALGFETFESIREDFNNRYRPYLDQITTIDSFVIGNIYNGWDISFCAQSYNIQTGIYYKKASNVPTGMLIKANISNGKYPNTWLTQGVCLKYYFYSEKDKFTKKNGENFEYNQLLLDNPDLPILIFIKENKNEYRYKGIFNYEAHSIEPNGERYFSLRKNFDIEERYTIEAAVEAEPIIQSNSSRRTIQVVVDQFVRNFQVVRERLSIANGICERCHKPAPFIRKTDQTPYLEVHHIVSLSNGGPDILSNTIALCPNCHRELHLG